MKKFGLTLFCCILIISAVFVFYMKLELEFSDTDNMTAKVFTITGIESGMAVRAGEDVTGIYVAAPDVLESDEIISVSSDTDVAYLVLDKNNSEGRVYSAVIKAASEGIAEMYLSSTSGEYMSEKIVVNVIAETELSVTVETVVETIKESETVQTEVTDSVTVYVTPSGTKYHLSQNCAGKNGSEVTLEEAVEKGYFPCKRCAIKE